MHSYIQVVFANFNSEEDIAQNLKLELDKNEGMGWNVVVGSDFGSHVFHRTKKYIYVRVLELYVLIWKS
jgi:dynein light chain LC8-type